MKSVDDSSKGQTLREAVRVIHIAVRLEEQMAAGLVSQHSPARRLA